MRSASTMFLNARVCSSTPGTPYVFGTEPIAMTKTSPLTVRPPPSNSGATLRLQLAASTTLDDALDDLGAGAS